MGSTAAGSRHARMKGETCRTTTLCAPRSQRGPDSPTAKFDVHPGIPANLRVRRRCVPGRHNLNPESPYLRIFKSTVFVRDHDRSLQFYVDQLGFSVLADARFEFGGRWVAVAPPDGSAILALVAPKRGSENYKHIGRHTQIGFIAQDINATFELWRSRGVHFHHPPQESLSAEHAPPSPTWTATRLNCWVPRDEPRNRGPEARNRRKAGS